MLGVTHGIHAFSTRIVARYSAILNILELPSGDLDQFVMSHRPGFSSDHARVSRPHLLCRFFGAWLAHNHRGNDSVNNPLALYRITTYHIALRHCNNQKTVMKPKISIAKIKGPDAQDPEKQDIAGRGAAPETPPARHPSPAIATETLPELSSPVCYLKEFSDW